MTSSEYNDNRPQDGHDDREQARAEREGYDLETMRRFHELLFRFYDHDMVATIDLSLVDTISAIMRRDHRWLLDREGF